MFEQGRVPKAMYLQDRQKDSRFPVKPQGVPDGDKEAYRRQIRRQKQMYKMLRNREHGR